MIAERYRPAGPLSAFVEELWLYDGYVSAHERERILPSGTFELVLNLSEDELRIYPANAGPVRKYSGAVVSGPYAGYFGSDAAEEVSIIGAHFRPGGAFPFLGCPAGLLADSHVDLAELWKGAAGELRERLLAARGAQERLRLLEHTLVERLEVPPQHHPAVAMALDAHDRPGAVTRTRELARSAGLSERRFIELFRREVGLSPKLFDRIRRFQRALQRVHSAADPGWAADALASGYCDQPHFIRDFREFTGVTPADYAARLHCLRAQGAHGKPNHLVFAGEFNFLQYARRPAAHHRARRTRQ